MKISRALLGDIYVFVVLFLSTGALDFLVIGQHPDPSTAANGSPAMKALWGILYLIAIPRILSRRRQIMQLIRVNKCLILLVLLSICSTIWSVDPGLTWRKSIPLLVTTLIGADLSVRYSLGEQLRLLWIVLGVFVVLGIVAQVVFPGLVPILDFEPGGAWNGLMSFKNDWARLIVLTGVVILCRRPGRSRVDSLVVTGLMVAVIALLVASRSATGLILMMSMILLFGAFRALRWRRKALVVAAPLTATLGLLLAYLAAGNLGNLALLFGRDTSLTGRVPVWIEALHNIAQRPFLGYGYDAFWSPSSRPATLIRESVNWPTLPHAHNGYIDLTLALGGVGIFLYLVAYFVTGRRAIRHLRSDGEQESMWPLAYLTLILLYQLTETSIVTPNTIFWIIFVSVSFSVAPTDSAYESPRMPASLRPEETLVAT